ncbi:MAG: carboxypeptidase M32 [Alphaproteobacteria bacterium]|nr:carboxypeptidase M32 [Alphaproteobacteria bacterium]
MATTAELWERFERANREIATWGWLQALAGWDQQTGMPPGAAGDRQEQEAALTRLLHERTTDPALGELLVALEGRDDPTELQRVAIEQATWGWRRSVAVDAGLAERLARVRSETMTAWLGARQTGDHGPWLAAMEGQLALVRERASAIAAATGHDGPLYDVLLEDYDRGVRSADLTALFDRLVPGLRGILDAVEPSPEPEAWAESADAQRALCEELSRAVGFDFSIGRLDRSEHPFTTRCGLRDVRITTRFLPDDPLGAVFATLHEAGHGMYEQGMAPSLAGAGLMHAPSTGLHESQSRFWENAIGRSPAFVRWLRGPLSRHLAAVPDAEALWTRVNRVARTPIRVEADQVTYNLHIALRFQLEQALISGELAVADLPAAWDDAMERTLGLRPADAATGVLQDIHWSFQLFGYFPSYTLGNVWAASFLLHLETELPVDELVGAGDFAPILGWFREHVHQRGATVRVDRLLKDAIGERDHVADLLTVLGRS